MPGFSIDNAGGPRNNVEFHRSHRWRIESLGFPGSGGGPEVNIAKLYAKSLNLPSLSFEEEKVSGGASNYYKLAKRAQWENVSVTFYDVLGLYNIFNKWQDLIWTPKDGIKKANDYKGQPIFALTNNVGDAIQIYTLFGAYPVDIKHGELSYTSSDIKILTVTYSFDWAERKILDSASIGSIAV